MDSPIVYQTDLSNVDWAQLKATLSEDNFDNGRTPDQLRDSFAGSQHTVLARTCERVIGTARALSDGVCNAYIVDVWTYRPYRRQGIARQMVEMLLAQLSGQHVYLFTDEYVAFYKALGFAPQPVGLGRVIGTWLSAD